MKRSKEIIVVSHCILNQNTVIAEEARAMGSIPSVVDWVLKEGYGFLQLPCPEFTYLGINRDSMTYEQYDTLDYRNHCSKILIPVVEQLIEYKNNGFKIKGMVGIGHSPSCDPSRGVFIEEFNKLLQKSNIDIEDFWYLPPVEDPIFDPEVHKKA